MTKTKVRIYLNTNTLLLLFFILIFKVQFVIHHCDNRSFIVTWYDRLLFYITYISVIISVVMSSICDTKPSFPFLVPVAVPARCGDSGHH